MSYFFGVDVGGTTVKMGFFEKEGTLIDKWEIPSSKDLGGEASLRVIADAIRERLRKEGATLQDMRGVGIDIPGPVLPDGSTPRLTNLDWGEALNIREMLSSLLDGIHVEVANDGNAAALGELWKGAGEGMNSLVMVTLGTGVGGGIVTDGRIISGVHGAGGEIGHINVSEEETDICGCGLRGCLEQYAAAPGIVRITKKRLKEMDATSRLRGLPDLTAKDVLDCVKEGDPVAKDAFRVMCNMLGKALATVAVNADPDLFVIGGGVSKAGSILTESIRPYYEKYAFHAVRNTPIVLARLGNDGGMYGAARLVLS